MRRYFALLSIFGLLALACRASQLEAADPTGAKGPEGDIRRTIAAFEEAFNRGDAKGVAACWTADGEFVGPAGERLQGVGQIEAAYEQFLASHQGSKLRLSPMAIRMLTDDVAMVDLLSVMAPIPEGLPAEPSTSMVLVRRDGRWRIGSMRETLSPTASHFLRLKSLEWLVGDWSGVIEGDVDSAVRSSCDWTARSNFLIRKFTREGKHGAESAGTEVIGWDPRTHQIRSWTFDADGGFGESTWTQDGDRWIIRYAGTRPNGGEVTATHRVRVVDADTLAVESEDRVIEGRREPDLKEVTIKRVAPADAAKTPTPPVAPPRQVLP